MHIGIWRNFGFALESSKLQNIRTTVGKKGYFDFLPQNSGVHATPGFKTFIPATGLPDPETDF